MPAAGSADAAPAPQRPRLESFPPLVGADAVVLVLGSMPGAASLAAGQYYAHPRNAFWPIMGELAGAGPDLPYPQRVARLKAARIAVWDVLATCLREGSLDSRIESGSLIVHDFPGFFAAHPRIGHVFFNGATADNLFRQRALPALAARGLSHFRLHRLPSTSPANAAWSLARKIAAWRVVAEVLAAADGK